MTVTLQTPLDAIERKPIVATEAKLYQDLETMSFLGENCELRKPVSEVANALLAEFNLDLKMHINEDPETGDSSIVFIVLARESSPELRKSLRDFEMNRLPESARPHVDQMVFRVGVL